jgi:hypothetical protein
VTCPRGMIWKTEGYVLVSTRCVARLVAAWLGLEGLENRAGPDGLSGRHSVVTLPVPDQVIDCRTTMVPAVSTHGQCW